VKVADMLDQNQLLGSVAHHGVGEGAAKTINTDYKLLDI
jgi:hypothetical protein